MCVCMCSEPTQARRGNWSPRSGVIDVMSTKCVLSPLKESQVLFYLSNPHPKTHYFKIMYVCALVSAGVNGRPEEGAGCPVANMMLRTKFRSSTRAASAPDLWASSLTPNHNILFSEKTAKLASCPSPCDAQAILRLCQQADYCQVEP